jgi:hypothetical protein
MSSFIKNPRDFAAGALLLGIAAVFAYGQIGLSVGTSFRMGPGYFPLVLTVLLAALGSMILIAGLRAPREPMGIIPWRGLILVTLSVVFFGATLKGLGLVPALAVTIFVSSLASRRWDWVTSAATTVVLVLFSWSVFVVALGVPVAPFGPWVGGY